VRSSAGCWRKRRTTSLTAWCHFLGRALEALKVVPKRASDGLFDGCWLFLCHWKRRGQIAEIAPV